MLIKIKQNWVNSKRKSNSKVDFSRLSSDEIQNAKMILHRVAQLEPYLEELPFKPFIHESLIGVGGHIKHADLPFNTKHQIIIHHKHQIASLILKDIHERYVKSCKTCCLQTYQQKDYQ